MMRLTDLKYHFRNMVQLLSPALFLALLLLLGGLGYHLIEKWSYLDAAYMTVITITTVGFGEVRPLSDYGKIFTICLILGGVVFYGLALDGILKTIIGKRFKTLVDEARVREKVRKLKNHFIICGGGRMAMAMVREFNRTGQPYVVLETNPDSIVSKSDILEKRQGLLLKKDALQEEALIEARIDKAVGLAAVLPTDADNLFVVLSARQLNPRLRIETRIANEHSRSKMIQAGADKVVSPYMVGGLQMARSLLFPDVDEFMEIAFNKANYEFPMRVLEVREGDDYAGKRLRDSGISEEGFICISYKDPSGHLSFAPRPELLMEPGSELLLLGSGSERPLL